MSTYWYFECPDHNPPLRSEGEFTQHTHDDHWRHALELADSRPVDRWAKPYSYRDDMEGRSLAYFDRNARRFLADHPYCRLRVVSEYGVYENVAMKNPVGPTAERDAERHRVFEEMREVDKAIQESE